MSDNELSDALYSLVEVMQSIRAMPDALLVDRINFILENPHVIEEIGGEGGLLIVAQEVDRRARDGNVNFVGHFYVTKLAMLSEVGREAMRRAVLEAKPASDAPQ